MRKLILAILCGWTGLAPTAPAAISIRTVPHAFAFAPCPVTVWIRAVSLESDRVMHVTLDGPSFYRSSTWALEGATAPLMHEVRWRDVPQGDYQVTATIGNARIRAQAAHSLRLLGPEGL